MKISTRMHDDRGRGDALEVLLRALAQLKIWIGRTVKPPSNGWGSEGTKVAAPTTMSGAVSPIARAIARMMPVMIPGAAAGRTEPLDHLPAARAERVGALALGLGHGLERLDAGDDDERQDDQGSVSGAGEQDGPEAQQPDEEGQAEDAVDDRRDAGQVADVGLQEAVDAVVAARTPRGRSAAADAEREGDGRHDDRELDRADEGRQDPRVRPAGATGTPVRKSRSSHGSPATRTSAAAAIRARIRMAIAARQAP